MVFQLTFENKTKKIYAFHSKYVAKDLLQYIPYMSVSDQSPSVQLYKETDVVQNLSGEAM